MDGWMDGWSMALGGLKVFGAGVFKFGGWLVGWLVVGVIFFFLQKFWIWVFLFLFLFCGGVK